MITKLDNMKISLVFVGTILAFGSVSGQGLQRLIIKSITADLKPNPYVDFIEFIIGGEYNDTITAKIPIKAEIPGDMVLNHYITYNGQEVPPMKGDLDGLFKDKFFAPDVLERGEPKDTFPKEAPVPANLAYVINRYKFSTEKLPLGLPDGTVSTKIFASRSNDDESNYFLCIHTEAALQTDLPQKPSLMG